MNESNVKLMKYLSEHFCNVPLESPLFYNAPIGLRFELGVQYRGGDNPFYFTNVLLRSSMIFREVFDSNEEMIVIVNSFSNIEPYTCFNLREEIFPTYLKDKRLMKEVITTEIERNYEDNGDLSIVKYQHILICKMESIDYNSILKAIAHHDFGIEPSISDSVFFINPYKHIIYHMYDDRGMDLISESKETLFPIYQKYNSWILAYDKKQIDNIFTN